MSLTGIAASIPVAIILGAIIGRLGSPPIMGGIAGAGAGVALSLLCHHLGLP